MTNESRALSDFILVAIIFSIQRIPQQIVQGVSHGCVGRLHTQLVPKGAMIDDMIGPPGATYDFESGNARKKLD